MSLVCRGQTAHEREVDFDLLGDLEDENARVFQAPLHIGNREARYAGEGRSVDVNLHRYREVMRRAMKCEDTSHLDRRITRGCDGSLITPGRERDFGKPRRFQNIIVHLFISSLIAAIATTGCNNDGARYGLFAGVKIDRTGLYMEGPRNMMCVATVLLETGMANAPAGADGSRMSKHDVSASLLFHFSGSLAWVSVDSLSVSAEDLFPLVLSFLDPANSWSFDLLAFVAPRSRCKSLGQTSTSKLQRDWRRPQLRLVN